jgi:superfamily II DNA or RNA helicase
MGDRRHQAEFRALLQSGFKRGTVLAHVVPAGGKSRLPGILAEMRPDLVTGWFVPRLALRDQAVLDTLKHFNLEFRDSGNDIDPRRQTRGFVATHAALIQAPELWRQELRTRPYALIFDELHHAKVNRDSTKRPVAAALALIAPEAQMRLYLCGTLETNDQTFIEGMEYRTTPGGYIIDAKSSVDHYLRYSRQDALEERAIVPLEFHFHDGPVSWTIDEHLMDFTLSEVTREEESAALYTALTTDMARKLFESGYTHWRTSSPLGQLIIVTARQGMARHYAAILRERGISVSLAIEDNESAQREIRAFRSRQTQALTTCAMCYEGLDAPPATHLICLTHIRSVPWIEQMLARIWRAHPGKTKAWAFVPDDPAFRRIVARIRAEDARVVPFPGIGPDWKGPYPLPIPVKSDLDRIQVEALDGMTAADQKLREVLRQEYHCTEPFIEEWITEFQRFRGRMGPIQTYAERCHTVRNEIADLARQCDAWSTPPDQEPDWGRYQGLLMRATGKSIEVMTEVELRHALEILRTMVPNAAIPLD